MTTSTPIARALRLPALLVALGASAAACETMDTGAAMSESGHTPAEEAKIADVIAFYEAAINDKDIEAARAYIGDDYIQHNPVAADGISGLEGFVGFLASTAPESRSTIEAAYIDGDHVILHVHSNRPEGTPGRAIVDIFRLDENGKVVEHWDVIQEIPETSANDNGMFYGDDD